MSLQNMSKSAVRVGKNYIKGYTDIQVKVRDATSNDPWGPSGTQMNELAQASYNQNDFVEMMELLDKRLNDKGKNWRHVFKALTVLDYLLHAGSENCVIYFRDNIYIVKTLKEFQYIDDYGKDQGANVRQKAKDITNLLQDEARLRDERRSRASMRDRMGGQPPERENEGDGDAEGRRRRQNDAQNRRGKEDAELQRAIEESKRMAREEQERIKREAKDEDELQRALALSKEEEEKRIRDLEQANQTALFDDSTNIDGPNAYANQNQQVDFFGNPLVDTTGGVNPYGVQPQYTSFNPYMQQQQMQMQTGYNPFLQQQVQHEQMLQQQYAEQQRQYELQQAAMQYQQMMTQPQPIQPQPTAFGSNNPFGPGFGAGPSQQQRPPQPVQQQQSQHNVPVGDLFSSEPAPSPAPAPQPASPAPQAGPPRTKTTQDPRFNELNRLLATGEGIDTFGNVGDMRLGASGGRVGAQRTGAPAPQAQAFGQMAFGNGQHANGQNGNGQPGQQQQQQQQQQQNEQPLFQL